EENYLLSCWGVLTPNIGIVDAMRIATDANASDDSFRMQVAESARWHHTHGILYLNDPDYICLRRNAAPARTLAALVSLNGYLYMISDDISAYNEEKLDIARKTMPPVDGAMTAETGALDTLSGMNYYRNILSPRVGETPLSHGNLWATHYYRYGRTWATVTLIHTWKGESPAKVEIPIENLGLDPELEYTAFDFWKQEPLGIARGSIVVAVPEYLDSTLLALTPVSDEVQLIGSSRHVSMDAVSVKGMTRSDDALEINLEGPEGSYADYWFTVPDGTDVSCSEDVTITRTDRYLKCRVGFTSTQRLLTLKVRRACSSSCKER
ncbi:MAG: hypothetical protein FWG37_05830, partial [Clostridia bacterium]|nr:hypothetical protein [Clostridia bacterium]